MDNGNNGNIHMFSEVHIMFSSSVDTIKRKNSIWSYICPCYMWDTVQFVRDRQLEKVKVMLHGPILNDDF